MSNSKIHPIGDQSSVIELVEDSIMERKAKQQTITTCQKKLGGAIDIGTALASSSQDLEGGEGSDAGATKADDTVINPVEWLA